jgi:hypothetical protein
VGVEKILNRRELQKTEIGGSSRKTLIGREKLKLACRSFEIN